MYCTFTLDTSHARFSSLSKKKKIFKLKSQNFANSVFTFRIFLVNKLYFCKYCAQVLMCNFRYVATICSLNETWVTISCFRTQGARSTCFFYKGKPVSFYGFSYNGRKTLCKLRVVSSGQAGYNGCWCACLPTCHLGRAW